MNKETKEGYQAYAEGIRLIDCPYSGEQQPMFIDWHDGWKTASEDHKEYLDNISPLREEDTQPSPIGQQFQDEYVIKLDWLDSQ